MVLAHEVATRARSVPVIVNVDAGWLRPARSTRGAHLVRAFRRHGLEPDVQLVRESAVAGAVLAARARGARTVFVGGGDGTISTAASVLMGTGTALGVLPLGTRNHFALDLGLPRDPLAAVRAAAEGVVEDVDVGEVNGQVFVNNLSLGLYPSLVQDSTRHHRHLGVPKGAALAFSLLGALWRLPSVRVRIHAPGIDHQAPVEAPFVLIGNNEYALEVGRFGRRGSLGRGELALYWAEGIGRVGLAMSMLLRHRFAPLSRRLVPYVELTSPRKHLVVALDGEVKRLRSPLHVRSRPGALRVVVPGRASRP